VSKFRCVCGHVLNTSGQIPNPDEWLFMSDVEFAEYEGNVDGERLYSKFGRAYVCPVSGHLWIFHDPSQTDHPAGYVPLAPTREPGAQKAQGDS
jgi:hypothetical protein